MFQRNSKHFHFVVLHETKNAFFQSLVCMQQKKPIIFCKNSVLSTFTLSYIFVPFSCRSSLLHLLTKCEGKKIVVVTAVGHIANKWQEEGSIIRATSKTKKTG